MPPPPVNPQGSRAGLITAVVVLSILFVTSAIFAFYYSAENNRAVKSLEDQRKLLDRFASTEAQADTQISAIADLRNTDPRYQNMSAIQILMQQRNELAQANATLSTNINELTSKVKSLEAEIEQKNEELAAATEKVTQEIALREKMQAELAGKFDEQGKQLTEALAQLAEHRSAGDESVSKIQSEADRALKAAQAEASKLQKELGERESELATLQREQGILKEKLASFRAAGTQESVIRQADGRVIRVPGNDNVFINLGLGDQITPGMTFEVYDRFSGVPEPGGDELNDQDETQLPKGKASIEVVRLGQGQSEARIVRQTLGQPVVEGDLVANLVYDKNTRYNFVVFGDFDLDQDGTATPGDADVVRRLITQWGGRVQDQVNVNIDFIVLGREPEVPVQEDNETPTDIARRVAAQGALDAYQEVVSTARDLNIPILNQNRFLYYIGYYERAQR